MRRICAEINHRLSFMRFLGLGLSDRVPDARTIWLFREKPTRAGAIKEGRVPGGWANKPAKFAHKDRDARLSGFASKSLSAEGWTVKFTKAKAQADGTMPPVDIAIPAFGYKNHVSIDTEFGLIRTWLATDAAAYDGARLREGLLDKTNTASAVWADTGYRLKANEDFMAKNGFVSKVPRKKPKGRPMPDITRRANALKSKVRSHVEHVFAVQKDRMDLFIRTNGIAGVTTKIGMANIVYSPVGTARSAQTDAVPEKDHARMKGQRRCPRAQDFTGRQTKREKRPNHATQATLADIKSSPLTSKSR